MDEANGEVMPMGARKITTERTTPKDNASSELPIQSILPIFMLAVIELDFSFKLIHLIRTNAPLWYVSSGLVIQLMLVTAAFTYRRIWLILRSSELSAVDRESLLAKIGYMVMGLLFALMFYSHYAILAAKAPQ